MMAVLLFLFSREILKIAVAAEKEMKAPAIGDSDPASPNFTKIGASPQATPLPSPNANALAGIFENRP